MKFLAKAIIKELLLIGQAGADTTVKILEKDDNGKIARATCTTVPSATAGYAIGCLLIDTATGQIYVNTGSATSCSFTTTEAGTTASPAAAGNSLATATDLTADFNAVTGADGTKAVSLPAPVVNKVVTIINTDASNALPVYPDAAGTQINALGAGNAFTITAGQTATFVCRSATLWYVAAATDTVTGLTASAAELNFNDTAVAGTSVASKTLVLGTSKNTDILGLPVSGLKIGAAGAEVAVTPTAAELNVNAGVTPGAVSASKTLVADAQSSLDTLRARTNMVLGGTGVPGAATTQTEITKAVTAFTDTTAKDVFTVTIPNAVHAAVIEVNSLGVLGAGGAVGAGEAVKNSKYYVSVVRTTGVNAVATVSAEVGTGAAATVAGGNNVTSVVVTASAIAGAVGDPNTFTIKVAITKAAGASNNHTLVASARILNQNATGITIA